MRTVLISGGAGFIGSALARRLTGSSRVIVLSRNPRGQDQAHHEHFEDAVADADLVFNLAGTSGAVASNRDPAESLATSCGWQLRFLEACANSPRRPHVVFASSRLVYGRPTRTPVTEDHPLNPQSFYAAHKLCVENYHRIFAQRGMTFTICRISNPYGLDLGAHPSQEYGFLNRMVRWAVEGSPLRLFGEGDQLRDYIYIDDLVDALLLCGSSGNARNEVFNIGSGAGVSIAAAAREIAAQSGAVIENVPWPEGYIDVETGHFVNSIEKANSLLGFAPRVSFAEGISRTIAAYREQGRP